MELISAKRLQEVLDFPSLVDAVREAFTEQVTVPERLHYHLERSGGEAGLLVMPAWNQDAIGCKLLNMVPANSERGIEANNGLYCLFDGETGLPQAVMDASELTALRTAAASALAASYLARKDARRLLIVGAGKIARYVTGAYLAVRQIELVRCWARREGQALELAAALSSMHPEVQVEVASDLASACSDSDVISCMTRTVEPLIYGAWVRPGTHLDLIGGYRPDMREVDDDCVRKSRIFADVRENALKEAGDIVIPIQTGVITADAIEADLADLAAGVHPGRGGEEEITLFKSVGTALEDIAAARLAYERHRVS